MVCFKILLKKERIFLIFFCFYNINIDLNSQYTIFAQDPVSIKWRQINTEKFRLVYDSCFESEAQRIAAILEYTTNINGITLGQKHRKIPILIHNHHVVPNGFVTLLPARSEYYSTPPQETYGQGWFEQLAIHEGRHWEQLNRINHNTVAFLKFITGDIGWVIGSLQAHMWFLEGDAVATETALTNSGRGRLPSFEMGWRTIVLERGQAYDYRKAVWGSFKDYVPNHYELGYLMVAYNRVKYGPELWENVLDEISRKPLFIPFLSSIKNQTGMNRNNLYQQTFNNLYFLWYNKVKEINYTKFNYITNQNSEIYTSFLSPCFSEGKIYAIKTSLEDNPKVISIDLKDGKGEYLFTPGNLMSNRISVYKNFIFFDEYVPDKYWGYRSYSDIFMYNVNRHKKIRITKNCRYFAPDIDSDGKRIAVVENNIRGQNSIVIINSINGSIINRYPSPLNAEIQYPSWDLTGRLIVATLVDTSGKVLVILDTQNGEWDKLVSFKSNNISKPRFVGNYIVFEGTFSGIDNIYALDTISKQIYQVTSAKYGAFEPVVVPDSNLIICSVYNFKGYKIASTLFDSTNWTPLSQVKDVSLHLYDSIAIHEPYKFNYDSIKYKKYDSKPYRQFSHFLNIHSWLPFFIKFDATTFKDVPIIPGYYIMSQNLLRNFVVQGGQGYWRGSLYNQFDISYLALFPKISFGIKQGDTLRYYNVDNSLLPKKTQWLYNINVWFPFNFSRANIVSYFTPSIMYEYENFHYINSNNNLKKYSSTAYFKATYSIYEKKTMVSIVPSKGFIGNLMFIKPLGGHDIFSSQEVGEFDIFLPGFKKNHSFKFSFSGETQKVQHFLASSRLLSPRGYYNEWDTLERYVKDLGILSLDYFMPLTYPDQDIIKVIYLKRISLAFFMEAARANLYNKIERKYYIKDYFSAGCEMFADFNIFNFPYDLCFGIRYAYAANKNKYVMEPVVKLYTDF